MLSNIWDFGWNLFKKLFFTALVWGGSLAALALLLVFALSLAAVPLAFKAALGWLGAVVVLALAVRLGWNGAALNREAGRYGDREWVKVPWPFVG